MKIRRLLRTWLIIAWLLSQLITLALVTFILIKGDPRMKTYEVYVFSHMSGNVRVKAKSPEEAKRLLQNYTLKDFYENAVSFEVDYNNPDMSDLKEVSK